MVYVTSDLHGCSLQTLQNLLNAAHFSENDTLFILGDVIDRGPHGAELLLWMSQQNNVELILGNHEALLLSCAFLFDEVSEQSLEKLNADKMQLLENWILNGGGSTMKGFRTLLKTDPESVEGILDYLRDCPLYEVIRVNKEVYILVHAGLDNFNPSRDLSEYAPEELFMARPTVNTQYYLDSNITVIFGHTPTSYLDAASEGRALHSDSWTCIDTGAAYGNNPMLLRLDDFREFYC